MRYRALTLPILIGGICLFGAGSRAHASPPPSSISLELEAGDKTITAWVVVTSNELEQGLSDILWLGENEGMLFVLPKRVKTKFHMKEVKISLSIAYLNRRGKIVKIEDMDPKKPEVLYEAPGEARYALEMSQGWFKRHGLKEGDSIRRKN